VSVERRPWHQLDVDLFRESLLASPLCRPDCWYSDRPVDELASLYDSEMTSILDTIIPFCTIQTCRRSSDPWFHRECRLTKRAIRRLEQLARSCGTQEATDAWTIKRREYRTMLRQKTSSLSGRQRSKPRSRCHVSCGVLSTPCSWSWARPRLSDEIDADVS